MMINIMIINIEYINKYRVYKCDSDSDNKYDSDNECDSDNKYRVYKYDSEASEYNPRSC